mgnify:CR=1 FL=1
MRQRVGLLARKDDTARFPTRKSGFAMQSLLIGLGAVLSSALPFILTNGFGVSKEATVESPVPPAVRLAFYIGAGVFILRLGDVTTRAARPACRSRQAGSRPTGCQPFVTEENQHRIKTRIP